MGNSWAVRNLDVIYLPGLHVCSEHIFLCYFNIELLQIM